MLVRIAVHAKNGAPLRDISGTGAGKITHIVYIVQENRSFDDLFKAIRARIRSQRQELEGPNDQAAAGPLSHQYDIDHSAEAMFAACNAPAGDLPGTHCRMDGFDKEVLTAAAVRRIREYVYVPHSDRKPYFDMAHEGVLADRMFQSQLDESFVAHQYIIAAQAEWSVDLPGGEWGCEGGRYDEVDDHQPRIGRSTRRTCSPRASTIRRWATSSTRRI